MAVHLSGTGHAHLGTGGKGRGQGTVRSSFVAPSAGDTESCRLPHHVDFRAVCPRGVASPELRAWERLFQSR